VLTLLVATASLLEYSLQKQRTHAYLGLESILAVVYLYQPAVVSGYRVGRCVATLARVFKALVARERIGTGIKYPY
jgi:tetrahydromethanopterin S-methyltransferase subunit D